MKEVYIKTNGKIQDKKENDEEEVNASYLNISDMFEGVKPLTMTELDSSEIDYFFKLIKKENYNHYVYLIHGLMNKIITCKDFNDLTSMNKGSFYSHLKYEYVENRKQRTINNNHPMAKLNPTPEFISTAVRIVIRNYIDTFIEGLIDANAIVGKNPYDVLKINNTRISKIKNSRLDTDIKLNAYIKKIYNTKISSLTVDTKGHLCNKCHFETVFDCPKVQYVIPFGMNIGDEQLDFITDAQQIIDDGVTVKCIVTGCRKYGELEKKYLEKQAKGETEEEPKKKLYTKEDDRELVFESKNGRIYRKKI